jgi:hypothetical protein
MAVLERVLRAVAIVASVAVVLGWGLFVIDETSAASKQTQAEIAGQEAARRADPSPDQERAREAANGAVHEAIDDVNDVLLKPFASISDGSSSTWVRRTVPALLALVVYGFGLGMLARFAAGRF